MNDEQQYIKDEKKLRQILVYGLTPREKRILALRFGFIDGIPKTLEETGKEFSVTRERVRQIESKILMKIIHFRL